MDPLFSMRKAREYMLLALREAKRAYEHGDVPVGCVIVDFSGEIVALARNTREQSLMIHGHAEINAINAAAEKKGTLKLRDCALFVTLEPCPMCMAAIHDAGIRAVYFGAPATSCGPAPDPLPERYAFDVYRGICEEPCRDLITSFFRREIRNRNT